MKEIVLEKPFASEEEYFLFEEKSELKHEYINSTLFEMSGATKFHNKLRRRLAYLLEHLISPTKYEVYDENFKVRTPDGNFLYPDITICLADAHLYYTLDPVLIIEILSKSTRRFDLADKFIQYAKCPTLEYYLCIEPEKKVIYFYHQDGEDWVAEEAYTNDDDMINLPKLGISISVKDIYNA